MPHDWRSQSAARTRGSSLSSTTVSGMYDFHTLSTAVLKSWYSTFSESAMQACTSSGAQRLAAPLPIFHTVISSISRRGHDPSARHFTHHHDAAC